MQDTTQLLYEWVYWKLNPEVRIKVITVNSMNGLIDVRSQRPDLMTHRIHINDVEKITDEQELYELNLITL